MDEEMDTLIKMNCFELVDRPLDKPVIGCRWVYKVKKGKNGEVERFKARLVAQGFAQEYGVNFFETYAPVVKCSTLRLLMAIAVKCKFRVEQVDVKNAYINSDLKEEVYMKQPKGYNSGDGNKVLKLKKSLYGLKQSGNMWNHSVNEAMIDMKFTRLKGDPCVYFKGERENVLIVAVYVDDLVIMSRSADKINSFKQHLQERFEIDDIGLCKRILGINVMCSGDQIVIDQRHAIVDIIRNCGLWESKSVSTPMTTCVKLRMCENPGKTKDCGVIDEKRYRGIVGGLNYIASMTRPDLTHSVSFLSQFSRCPHEDHLTAALRAVKYLKGTIDRGISYNRHDNQDLMGYTDADWGGAADRKSFSGFVLYLSGGPIAWESKKQNSVALSSTEAEYMAATQAAKEIKFITNTLIELEMRAMYGKSGVILKCDNLSTISLAKKTGYSPKTKHIEIREHYIRERVERGEIKLEYVRTEDNVADIFTKGLGGLKHNLFSSRLQHSIEEAC